MVHKRAEITHFAVDLSMSVMFSGPTITRKWTIIMDGDIWWSPIMNIIFTNVISSNNNNNKGYVPRGTVQLVDQSTLACFQ